MPDIVPPPGYGFIPSSYFDPPSTSIFAETRNLPNMESDFMRWDQTWEQIIPTLSASQDVFAVLSPSWMRRDEDPLRTLQRLSLLHRKVAQAQMTVAILWDSIATGDRNALLSWLKVSERERTRHVLNGLLFVSKYASCGQDGRAMCPEITSTALLSESGKAFMRFFRVYAEGIKSVGQDAIYLLPNQWWTQAVDTAQPLHQDVEFAHTQLTMQRNEFLVDFILHTIMSFIYEGRGHGFVSLGGEVEALLAEREARALQQPHCENCAMSEEQLSEGYPFMLCGPCKSILDFSVYYCSKTCQKEDWRKHKQYCGKVRHREPVTRTATSYPAPSNQKDDFNNRGFRSSRRPPTRRRSAALRRQVALLRADKEKEYFLFDDNGTPVPFECEKDYIKTCFRVVRGEAFDHLDTGGPGPEVLAEYLIKMTASTPGLSRRGILAQFNDEYGPNTASDVAQLEVERRMAGEDLTHLETMASKVPELFEDALLRMDGLISD